MLRVRVTPGSPILLTSNDTAKKRVAPQFTAAADGEVLLWSRSSTTDIAGSEWKPTSVTGSKLADLRRGFPIASQAASITRIEYSPDGRRLLTVADDRTVRLWDNFDGRELLQLVGHADQITAAHFNADASRIATNSLDGTTRLWNSATGRVVAVLTAPSGAMTAAAFSSD